MTLTPENQVEWVAAVRQFAEVNGLSQMDSSELLKEYDGDVELAQSQFATRFQPAMAEWEALRDRFGFRLPFPVRIQLPSGNRVYHKLKSLTLSREGDLILMKCSTQFLGKPGGYSDGATCTFTHKFIYLPQLRCLTDIFEHWVPPERARHFEELARTHVRSHLEDENFFYNPDSWTMQDFLNNRGACIQRVGEGTCLVLNIGCLGYCGATSSIYLLSHQGLNGAILTSNVWSVYLKQHDFSIWKRDTPVDFPELDETPFEFVKANAGW